MSNQNFWGVRLGESWNEGYEYIYARYSIISIGYDINMDLRNSKDKKVQAHLATYSGRSRKQIEGFLYDMQKGDIVILQIMPEKVDPTEYEYEIAMVVGDYKPLNKIIKQKKIPQNKRPARLVSRLAKGIRLSDLGRTSGLFRPRDTITPINPIHKDRIFKLLYGSHKRLIPSMY